jgi:hypothetical protein
MKLSKSAIETPETLYEALDTEVFGMAFTFQGWLSINCR